MNATTTKGQVVKSFAEEKAEVVQAAKIAEQVKGAEQTIEALEKRIIALEKFADWAKQKLHFSDQEVTVPQKRNHNPDYLPHSVQGVVSYHDRPKQNE